VLVRETEDGQVRLLVQAVDGRTPELEWVPVARPVAGPLAPHPSAATPSVATAGGATAGERAGIEAVPGGAPATPPVGRRSLTPAQVGYRARLTAQDDAHYARQRGLKTYNARRRAEALARPATR
jgi:hypothetical protein